MRPHRSLSAFGALDDRERVARPIGDLAAQKLEVLDQSHRRQQLVAMRDNRRRAAVVDQGAAASRVAAEN